MTHVHTIAASEAVTNDDAGYMLPLWNNSSRWYKYIGDVVKEWSNDTLSAGYDVTDGQ